MTNGEKIKEIFPNGVLTSDGNNSYYWGNNILVSKEYWNAEYKEPTTKDEHHRQNIQAYAHDFGVSEEQAEKELRVTTKNNIPHCQCTDAEIAKSFIEDVEAVKDQLPTTKNNLGVDCISRFEVTEILNSEYDIDKMLDRVDELPSVTPQEPILDKIIAEIEQTSETVDRFLMHDGTKRTVLKILDKYKAKSEPQESEDT